MGLEGSRIPVYDGALLTQATAVRNTVLMFSLNDKIFFFCWFIFKDIERFNIQITREDGNRAVNTEISSRRVMSLASKDR